VPRVKVPLLLLLTVLLNGSVLASIRIAHVRPDALMLMTILVALSVGPERGAVLGFAAGVLADLTLQTPFGLSALVLALVGFAVGTMQTAILRSSWWIPPLTAAIASAIGVALFVVLGAIVGQSHLLRPGLLHVGVIAGLVAVMNGVLAVPASALVRWAFSGGQPERAYATK
jgi:rod shape-determining protein MreD